MSVHMQGVKLNGALFTLSGNYALHCGFDSSVNYKQPNTLLLSALATSLHESFMGIKKVCPHQHARPKCRHKRCA
eukprot:5019742-Amphidinium_carterae.2